MSWDFCVSKHVKTRKEHKCTFCGRVIPIGGKDILHWHGMFEGEFQNSYACHWCEEHQSELLDDDNRITEEFSNALTEDVFYEKLGYLCIRHMHMYVQEDEQDIDWFVFFDYDTDLEVHREYCPILSKDILK